MRRVSGQEIGELQLGQDPSSEPSPQSLANGSPPRAAPISSFCPWPRCCPWVLIGPGVALGTLLGFTPWLFLAIGSLCLLNGCVLPQS